MFEANIKTEFDFGGRTHLQKRCDFFQRHQKSDETIYTYLEVIRNLANCCSFYTTEEELLVRDRLVSGLNDKDLQTKVLETFENPTIEDVVNFYVTAITFVEEQTEDQYSKNLIKVFIGDAEESSINDDFGDGGVNIDVKEEINYFSDGEDETKDVSFSKNNTENISNELNNLFQEHGWAYPECSACGKSFTDFKHFKGHLVEHGIRKNSKRPAESSEPNFSKQNCELCDRGFKSQLELVSHYAVHSTSKICLPRVKCTICRKLSSIQNLGKHMMMHADGNTYSCTVCNKKLNSKPQLKGHLRIHKEHGTVICDLCGKSFKRQVYLNVHKEKMHPILDPKIQSLECYLCKQQYKSMPTLKLHIDRHMLARNYLCTHCGQRFRDAWSLKKHLMREDDNGLDNRKFQCEVCGKKLTDRTQYVNHRKIHEKDRPFKCSYENCSKGYKNLSNLKQHYKEHTGEKESEQMTGRPKIIREDFFNDFERKGWPFPTCSACGKTFDTFKHLKGHLVEHVVNKKSTPKKSNTATDGLCLFCKKKFQSYDKLVLHYASHTRNYKLPLPNINCSVCGKACRIINFKKHMYQHTDETPFACTFCEKSFKTKFQWTAHMKIHRRHKTTVCDICGNTFKSQLYLQCHKDRAHPVLDPKIQALECYLCKQQYKSVSSLKQHIYMHWLPRNHLCTQCGLCFQRAGALKKHLMREDHNGIDNRKFECVICSKKFCDKTMFDTHQYKFHRKERPYKCTFVNCDKSYLYSQSLKEHQRLHTGERPYPCNLCDYKGMTSCHLRRHMCVHTGQRLIRKDRIKPTQLLQL